ncbi:Hypp4736 [Branchiostoma lanceolatum]|uniref:Hypp4736 protein n=1 Tax=Branchiostoma lanceolatum TaxID=7740 RepID=A0A8K0EZ76_BRALA|nr:Hypp4736 [Branchiostoma lanceolatum]
MTVQKGYTAEMRQTVTAVLLVLAVFCLFSLDQSTAYSSSSQKYTCSLKYKLNNTVYETNDAFLPVNATKFNLCRDGALCCTYYTGCSSKYLSRDGRNIMDNLDPWTATHVGDRTIQPRPESIFVCNRAPCGMIQKGTMMTITTSIILVLVTTLCLLHS